MPDDMDGRRAPDEAKENDANDAVTKALGDVYRHLRHLEEAMQPEIAAVRSAEHRIESLGRKATQGEHRLPVVALVALAIALQLVLPEDLSLHPIWLFPAAEGALMVVLTVANPIRINRTSTLLRSASIALIALISLANAWSSAKLIVALINTSITSAPLLLARGASVYGTNIIVFALWFWELDRGGPIARTSGTNRYPDFLFPQMTQEHLADPEWKPNVLDYFYVSFTNAMAFSPTDTMPLTRWAKMLMLLQSAVALLTVAFVVARAVNILK
jgi:uncharacterized membrane protein